MCFVVRVRVRSCALVFVCSFMRSCVRACVVVHACDSTVLTIYDCAQLHVTARYFRQTHARTHRIVSHHIVLHCIVPFCIMSSRNSHAPSCMLNVACEFLGMRVRAYKFMHAIRPHPAHGRCRTHMAVRELESFMAACSRELEFALKC